MRYLLTVFGLTEPTFIESILADNTMEGLEAVGHQRLEDLLGQEAVKMGQTILLIQVRLSLRDIEISQSSPSLSGPVSRGQDPGEDYRGGPSVIDLTFLMLSLLVQ